MNMKTGELSEALFIFSGVSKKNALTEEYRCLLLSPEGIRGAAPFGVVEVFFDMPVEDTVFVDGEKFISLMKTLPDEEVELVAKKTMLQWKCGSSKGQFALRAAKKPAPLKLPTTHSFDIPEGFGEKLQLAATSCDSPALIALGLFGVVVENLEDDTLIGYSSNNRTVSSALLGAGGDLGGSTLTLSPEAVRILSLASRAEGAVLATGDGLVGVRSPKMQILLRQVAPLKQDLRSTITRFESSERKVSLQRAPISEFLRRVSILAEDRGQSRITIGIEDGSTTLAFKDGTASSDFVYESEDAGDLKEEVRLDSRDFASIIGKVDALVFDHVGDGAAVLESADGKFRYIMDLD